MKINIIKTIILSLLILSCTNLKTTDAEVFISNIKTEAWNTNLKSFISRKCEINTDSLISSDINLKLNLFLKNRDIMLKELSKEVKMLGNKVDTLVIKESFFDISTFDSSFFIMNDLVQEGLVIYMKNHTIEKIEKIDDAFYNKVLLRKEPACINQIRGGINTAIFTSVFFMNESNDLVMETKNGYLGVMVD